jgi:hypothetical protein
MLQKYECGVTVDFNKKELFLKTVINLISIEYLKAARANASSFHQKKYNWEIVSKKFYEIILHLYFIY